MGELRDSVKIGNHRCLWTADGGSEVDLGLTADGVVVKVATSVYERTVAELNAPFDSRVDKRDITAEVVLKETPLETVAAALSALKTSKAGTPTVVSADVSPERGEQMLFGLVVFRPRGLTSSDKSQDKTFFNAIVMGNSDMPFKANDDQTVSFSIKAGAYYDANLTAWRLFCIGDPSTDVGFLVEA